MRVLFRHALLAVPGVPLWVCSEGGGEHARSCGVDVADCALLEEPVEVELLLVGGGGDHGLAGAELLGILIEIGHIFII